MSNWQTIVSALIVISAGLYIGWRIYSQLRSLVHTTTKNKTSRPSGCDKCPFAR